MPFHDLRDAQGRLVGRYDPERNLLEIKPKGGVKSLFDLNQKRGGEALNVRITPASSSR